MLLATGFDFIGVIFPASLTLFYQGCVRLCRYMVVFGTNMLRAGMVESRELDKNIGFLN
jgi:hypothetical protein